MEIKHNLSLYFIFLIEVGNEQFDSRIYFLSMFYNISYKFSKYTFKYKPCI